MRVSLERLLIFAYTSFPFGFEGGVWDLIILVPDHLYFYFETLLMTNPLFIFMYKICCTQKNDQPD